jgi:hypothetical protein
VLWALFASVLLARLATTEQTTAAAQQRATPGAQWSQPRTAWGDPDIDGVYTNKDETSIPFERPKEFTGRSLEDITPHELATLIEQRRAAREYRDVNPPPGFVQSPPHWNEHSFNNSRAWLVVDPADGQIPPLKPEARVRMPEGREGSSWGSGPFNSHLDFDLGDRCITRGLPSSMLPGGNFTSYRIVQSPGFVTIAYEMGHEARVIPLVEGPHVSSGIRLYMGDARGHFDGDTLVVETTNFTDRVSFRGSGPDMRLVERFTPKGPSTLEWSVTVHDSSAWDRPWTFALNLTKDATQPPFEYACHEGNYGLKHILEIARAADRAATGAASRPAAEDAASTEGGVQP